MKQRGLIPRKVKGFRDIDPALNEQRNRLVQVASKVYRSYGFEHWDSPILEYAECLGKYLPDQDTADEGVYSFRNPELEPILDMKGNGLRDSSNNVLMDNHLLSLRYDLTAPLARKYAEELWTGSGQTKSPTLFRRYQYGPVYRFEAKLDPGRYREFWQMDFDTVGASDVASDAEACCILSDTLEALGLARGSYEIRVNTRNLHKGLFEKLGISDEGVARDVLRVIDKYDKIGEAGIAAELGEGRVDPLSKAKIPGLGMPLDQVQTLVNYVQSCIGVQGRENVLARLEPLLGDTPTGRFGLDELQRIHEILNGLDYLDNRVVFDPSIARGLAYYTGPVFEAVSKLEYRDASGKVRGFGAICGGGRYDGLVEKLLGIKVPATGASIGVDRLLELLRQTQQLEIAATGPVLILVMDQQYMLEYQKFAKELRQAGIAAEVYYGQKSKMKAQMSYADQRQAPVVVIAGGNEFEQGTVSVKDLRRGKELSDQITDRSQWLSDKPAQMEVPRADLVATVKGMLSD